MVWCPKHNRYVNGRRGKEYHIKKYNCDFIKNIVFLNRKKGKHRNKKYNNRNPENKNPNLMTIYLRKRDKRRRSKIRSKEKQKR